MEVSHIGSVTVGEGVLLIIVKGEQKYRRYEVHVIKTADSDRWLVDEIR